MHLKLFKCIFAAAIILHQPVFAQEDTTIKPKSKASSKAMLKDTLDGKMDFSSFLIDAKGFYSCSVCYHRTCTWRIWFSYRTHLSYP
jgi:hypothetical protein